MFTIKVATFIKNIALIRGKETDRSTLFNIIRMKIYKNNKKKLILKSPQMNEVPHFIDSRYPQSFH